MIELKNICIGLRCPLCGRNVIEYINNFQFCSGCQITCEKCGATLFTITKNKRKNFSHNCFACGNIHTNTLSKSIFNSATLTAFGCTENDIDGLFIGSYEDVDISLFELSKELDALTEKYYENLEETYGNIATAAVRIIEEKVRGKRIICLCGSYEFNLKIEENGIIVSCPHCGAKEYISVKNEEELKELVDRRSILIR